MDLRRSERAATDRDEAERSAAFRDRSALGSLPTGETVPTTILLSRDADSWRATQHGVDTVGRAADPALAAARYCRQVASAAGAGEESSAAGATAERTDDERE